MPWTRGSQAVWQAARRIAAGAARLRPLSERRKTGRLKATALGCNRGTVVDLSSTGMRLRSTRRYTSTFDVDLWNGVRRMRVRAEVVWSKRYGFRKYELGLVFRDVTPQIVEDLNYFAFYLCNG